MIRDQLPAAEPLPKQKSSPFSAAGVQARSHVEALRIARRFEEIRVRSPTLEHAKRFAQEIGATATSAEEAVRDAEVIVTVTSSKTPVFKGAWLKVGAHVNAFGACRPDWRELDNSSVGRSDAECLFVKLDRELITHAENFAMVFAVIRNALFAQQFRVESRSTARNRRGRRRD